MPLSVAKVKKEMKKYFHGSLSGEGAISSCLSTQDTCALRNPFLDDSGTSSGTSMDAVSGDSWGISED